MKLFSKASEYTIRVLLEVVEAGLDKRFSPSEYCKQADVPEPFARKGLQALTQAGILKGTRGPGGGYRLAKDPGDITLLDVVLAVDGPHIFQECPLGQRCEYQVTSADFRQCQVCDKLEPNCGMSHVCPLHDLWKENVRMTILHLDKTSIQDIREYYEGRKEVATPPALSPGSPFGVDAGE